MFLTCESYGMSNVFAHVETYRNRANHLPAYERSHVLSLTAQHSGTATKYCRHAKSSVFLCEFMLLYSLKILLAMENTEPCAERLVCKNVTALSWAEPPAMFLLAEGRPEHHISGLRLYPKSTVQRGFIEGSGLGHKLE